MTYRVRKEGWTYWVIWLLIGSYFATVDVVNSPHGRERFLRIIFIDIALHLTWGAMLLPVMRNLHRIPMGGFRDWRRWAFYGALSIAMTFLGLVVAFGIIELLRGPHVTVPGGPITRFWAFHWKYFNIAFVDFLLAMAAWLAFDLYEQYKERELEASRLEAELARAQHQALRMQLQPHFLFNALNTINSLIRTEPDSAELMVTKLGDLLRYTLEQSGPQEVSLRQELLVLNCYLDIQRQRFGPRLDVVVACPDELLPAQVPNLILQPLAENAFKHGLGYRSKESCILIHISALGDTLRLEVEDNGRGLGPEPLREGIGLSNTRSRLEALYGSQHRFEILNGPRGGAIAILEIPLHWKPLPFQEEESGAHPTPLPQLRPRAIS